jgi:hypothetical protein
MKLYNSFFLILILLAFATTSCRKEETPLIEENTTPSVLSAPADFNWETTVESDVTIRTEMTESIGSLVNISIYDASPMENGNLIASGSAGYEFPFTTKIRIPSKLQQVFVQVTGARGTRQIASVPVSNNITYTFTEPKGGYKNGNNSSVTEPDCSGDVIVSGNNSFTVSGGKTYVISGSYSGKVAFSAANGGGTLKICGTASFTEDMVLGNNCHLVVTGSGNLTNMKDIKLDGNSTFTAYSNTTVQLKYLTLNESPCTFTNYSGSFVIDQHFEPKGNVYNYGMLKVTNDITQEGNVFTNNGTMEVTGKIQINKNLTNSGSINAANDIRFENATVINECKIISGHDVEIKTSSLTMDAGYIELDNKFINNSGSTVTIKNKSMISCKFFELNSNITGVGSKNSIKVSQQTKLHSSFKVTGAIELADQTGTLHTGTVAGNFSNGATFVSWNAITNYIPVSGCNPMGIGVAEIPDMDGDGVADNLDIYPLDATRAHDTYYPGLFIWGSIAFEDLWPM